MSAFEGIQILEAKLNGVGNNAMWDAALRILPVEHTNAERPVIARVTDARGNQICLTRLNGIPVLVASSLPHRFTGTANTFQTRWQLTPDHNVDVIQIEL